METKILTTEHMEDLSRRVYERLGEGYSYSKVEFTQFPNGEVKPKVMDTVRGYKTYLFHSMHYPNPNDAMMRLVLANDAIARGSAENITLVLPYMSYIRQDRKDEPRVPISARVMANLIETNPKVERIITLDMHCDQAQGFYNIPVDNLYGSIVQAEYFRNCFDMENLQVVSPDYGGSVRARRFARYLGKEDIGVIEKRRSKEGVKSLGYQGPSVDGKDVVIYDDMIDTGGSIRCASDLLYKIGAKSVNAVASHGIFSAKNGNYAEDNFRGSGMNVVVTESIPRSREYIEANKNWLTVLSLDSLLARAVSESSKVGGSISSLF